MAFELGRWLPEFPWRNSCLYLDHAGGSPVPRPVAVAMKEAMASAPCDEKQATKREQQLLTCRHLASQLAGANPDDVSLVPSASYGLSLIANSLSWQRGEEVLVGEEEFASNVAPWLALRDRGVKIVRFPQPSGRISVDAVAERMGPSTRLLAVSWVSFHTGWVAPLAQLGGLCREYGALLVVDGVQGFGLLPMEMRRLGVDALISSADTWLMGPLGIGLMITSPAMRAQLKPSIVGWGSVQLKGGDLFMTELRRRTDSRRFEPGRLPPILVAGLAAALDMVIQVGREVIQARVEAAVRHLMRILIGHGWEVYSPGSGHPVAGIVAARPPLASPKEAVRRLRERRIICAVRQGYVRFSPHFYTTRGELDALDRILEKTGL